MVIEKNEVSAKAMGGTELMALGLSERLSADDFQIICSRVRDLDESKYRIFWAHDLPGDPESEFLRGGGWSDFHAIVFVSHWQLWAYVTEYGIPMQMCHVIPNAIEPIAEHEKPDANVLNLIYYSTPHRGLELLVPVFEALYKINPNIHLDVYSSFNLYGWSERDVPYEPLFERCREHPAISYHGAVPNAEIREALKKAHILAYPSIWQETSCLVLIEAMSAGLVCVHSDLAALSETSGGLTHQYVYNPDPSVHANRFAHELSMAIKEYGPLCTLSKDRANMIHGWDRVIPKWVDLIEMIRRFQPARELARNVFTVRAG